MKAIVLEIRNGETVLLRDDGEIVRMRLNAQVGEQVELSDTPLQLPTAKQPWLRTAIAASLAIAIGAGTYTYLSVPASAYVSLDAGGKSVEIAVNRLGRIVSVQPKNKASLELANKLSDNVQGKHMNDGIRETVQSLQADGSLSKENGYLIAGVTANAPTTETEIAQIVEETTSVVQVQPVEIYTITVTDEERQEAEKTEQSAGSYAFDNREAERDRLREERREKRRQERRKKRREERRKKREEKRRKKEETAAELQTDAAVPTDAPVQTDAATQTVPPEQTAPAETTENVGTVETPTPAEETTPAAEQQTEQTEQQTDDAAETENDASEETESWDDPEKQEAAEKRKARRKEERKKRRKERRKKRRQQKKEAAKKAQQNGGEEQEQTENTSDETASAEDASE